MSSISLAPEVISSIRIEIGNLQVFIDTLKKEERALIEGEIDDLQTCATIKSKLINNFTTFNLMFREHMCDQGLEFDAINLDNSLPDQSESKVVWQEFIKFASIAREMNDSNRLIISALIHHNQCAFAALHCAAEKISIYDPKGQIYA